MGLDGGPTCFMSLTFLIEFFEYNAININYI